MEVKIKETGEIKELEIIDPKTGLDWAADLTAEDQNFTHDDDYRICDQETFDWWHDVIQRYQKADGRYYEIWKELDEHEELYNHVTEYTSVDVENYPEALEQALDAWEAVRIIRSNTTYSDAYSEISDAGIENPDLYWQKYQNECGLDTED